MFGDAFLNQAGWATHPPLVPQRTSRGGASLEMGGQGGLTTSLLPGKGVVGVGVGVGVTGGVHGLGVSRVGGWVGGE